MLQHPDSPYIRCIGFLYLRYVADPTTLYTKWFQPFVYDAEPVRIEASKSTKSTLSNVGDYVRFLLTSMSYYSTLLPRLPVSIQRDVQVKLVLQEEIHERAKYHASTQSNMEYFKTIGNRVQGMYSDDDNPIAWYDGVIDRVLLPAKNDDDSYNCDPYPKFIVTFPEYGNTETVSLGELDMPHANTNTSSATTTTSNHQNNNNTPYNHPTNHYNKRNHHYDRHHQQDDIMDRIRKQERDGVTTAKGKQYAKRPMTYKGSLATSTSSSSTRYATQMNNQPYVDNNTSSTTASMTDSSKQNYHGVQEKKRKLLDKYG